MSRLAVLVVLIGCSGSSPGTGKGTGTGTGSPPVTTCDVSTEAAARAHYTKLTGKPATDEDFCVDISQTFTGWVNYGWFAHDLGCEYGEAIYECKLTTAGSPARAMAAAGWAAADQARRQELLVAYLSEIEDVRIVVDDSSAEFPKYQQTFTEPTYDDSTITYWVSDGGGMNPEVTYMQIKLAVLADGTFGDSEPLAQFTTVYE